MLFDLDALTENEEEIAELDKVLAKLQDCDLGNWDADFVDDLTKRIDKFGTRTKITALQWEQIERMKRQYGIE